MGKISLWKSGRVPIFCRSKSAIDYSGRRAKENGEKFLSHSNSLLSRSLSLSPLSLSKCGEGCTRVRVSKLSDPWLIYCLSTREWRFFIYFIYLFISGTFYLLLVVWRTAASEKGVKEGFTTVSWPVTSRCGMEYIICIYVFFIFLGSADDANRQNIKHIKQMSKLKQKTIAFYDISFRTTRP